MNIRELAEQLHDIGFNVFPDIVENGKKRPYIPLGTADPYLWEHLKTSGRLNKERLLQAYDNATAEGKTVYLGFIPGEITEGKYKGLKTFGIDFDAPENNEILGVTPEKCKEVGVLYEPSYTKGHSHIIGITADTTKYRKDHSLGIELFPDSTFHLAIYGNMEEVYDLKPMAISEVYPGWVAKLSEVKGIPIKTTKPTVQELKKGVPVHHRNDSAFKIAADYKDKGLTIEETNKLMFDSWNKKNNPPMNEQELITCIKSAYKRPVKQKEDKNKFLDEYEVFQKDKNGIIDGVTATNLGKLIYEKHGHFFTMRDSREIYHYNIDKGFYEKNGETIIKNLVEYYVDTFSCEHTKNEVLGWIRDYNYKDRTDITVPLNLINLKNGVLDIETNTLMDWTPDYIFFNQIATEYNPTAKYEYFENFLNEICKSQGVERKNIVDTIQEYIGYCLLRDYPFKNYVVLDGGGDNGKTALLNIVKLLFGEENNTSVGLQELNDRPFTKKQLFQKHINISDDLPKKALKYTGTIKQITGGSPLWADIKNHKDGISFVNFAKPWYACNELPETDDYTDAFFSRQIQITLTNRYLPIGDINIDNKSSFVRDTEIVKKLTTPEILSGILNYALIGLKRLMENKKFSDETTTDQKRDQWTRKTNPVVAFLTDECEIGDEDTCITVDDFYAEVRSYCERNKFDKPSSRKYVTDHVLDAGMGIRKLQRTIDSNSHVWCWVGVSSTTNPTVNKYVGKKAQDIEKQRSIV